MSPITLKVYSSVLQFSTLFLTICLIWFAFIYYPKIVSDYTIGNFSKQTRIAPVSASTKQFPIQMNEFRIVYETGSDTYYVFVTGSNLDTYLTNRNGARLALKSALSMSNLCGISVIYASVSNVKVPDRFAVDEEC